VTEIAGRFQLTPGVELSAFDAATRSSYLVRLPNGRHFQVSEPLYHLLGYLREPSSVADLVEAFARDHRMELGEVLVGELIGQVQELSGMVTELDAGDDPRPRPAGTRGAGPSTSFADLHARLDLVPAAVLRRVTAPLRVLYAGPVAAALLCLAIVTQVAVYLRLFVLPSQFNLVASPAEVYCWFLLSVVVHELGHVTACRRWKAAHGSLGVGLYFGMPVFFVDVTGAWRLSRWRRAVVDAGGIYFQLVFGVVLAALYAITQAPVWLWTVVTIDAAILLNLVPILKLDGYWLLSDLSGVPNLHRRTGEAIGRWIARRRGIDIGSGAFGELDAGSARAVLAYVAVSAGVVAAMLAVTVLTLPAIVTAVRLAPAQWLDSLQVLVVAVQGLSFPRVVAGVVNLLVPPLIVVNVAILLTRLVRPLLELVGGGRRVA
jgi:putative peptide zinc metalloprotease protein